MNSPIGGGLARKGDGDPGVTHIWRGLKELASIIEGAKLFQDIYGYRKPTTPCIRVRTGRFTKRSEA